MAALVGDAHAFTSLAVDEGHLSPWITWPTVHRGVPNTVHGIGHFGQDTALADEVAPPWWDTIRAEGLRVGLFGLLHTGKVPADRTGLDFFVPDTFAASPETLPSSLEPFQAFNLAMARASARNVSTGIDYGAAARFLRTASSVGLRPATVATILRQLVQERREPLTRVRRRTLQSVLAFDLYAAQLRRTGPDVSAFFTNHVASAMHRYWAATFPEDYPSDEFGFDADWVRTWGNEIDHAMAAAEVMVGRLVRHCRDHGSWLVVASSMGQHAAQGTPIRTQLHLTEPAWFLADAGIGPDEFRLRPAMVPHVNVQVSGAAAERLRRRLGTVRVGGAPIEWHEVDDLFSITFGQADDAIGEVTVDGEPRALASLGLTVVDIEDEAASTGYHVPEGVLLVLAPNRAAPAGHDRPEVPTTAIAPWLHHAVGLPPARHHVDDGSVIAARVGADTSPRG